MTSATSGNSEYADLSEVDKFDNDACGWCGKSKFGHEGAGGCDHNDFVTFGDNILVPTIPYGSETLSDDYKNDPFFHFPWYCWCGAEYGHSHHPLCFDEECPRCHIKFSKCGCVVFRHKVDH